MSKLGRADGRPRIHIWPARYGDASWSIGPCGKKWASTSPGGALDVALVHIGTQAAVVIIEPIA